MPGYFKKRRHAQGPNKNEEKVLRAQSEENRARMAGTLSARFPSVKSLRVHLTFLDARQQVLEEKDMELGRSDAAIFVIPCPGRCGQGSFDFTKKLAENIEGRLDVSESGAKCAEPLYAGSAEACGCEIRCRVKIDYLPALPA